MPEAYFPSLDKTLAGEAPVISWKTAHRALCDASSAEENAALESFLTDDDSAKVLSTALRPFVEPTEASRKDFDTKTAPIHVSQSANGDYDLEQLKNDALWMSKSLNIEELVGLRVVIIEWQQRSEAQLRESAQLVETANGSVFSSQAFSYEDKRRARQLEIYLEEKTHLLKLSTSLVERGAIPRKDQIVAETWIDTLADKVILEQCAATNPKSQDFFCGRCVESLDAAVTELGDPSKWPPAFIADETKQFQYSTALRQNLLTTLRLLLVNIHLFKSIPSSNTILCWFKFMARVNFFEDLPPSEGFPEGPAIQSLASVISLSIQHLVDVIEHTQVASNGVAESESLRLLEDSYILRHSCCREINIILYQAAQQGSVLAGPAMFAWSLHTGIIREIAKHEQDLREQQRMDDGSDDNSPLRRRASRRDSREEQSTAEKLYAVLQDFELEGEARDDPPLFFARVAVDRLGVYSSITQLTTLIAADRGSNTEAGPSFISRMALFDLIQVGMDVVSYGAEVLEALLTVLSPNVSGGTGTLDYFLADKFLTDAHFRSQILDQAISRYPYEISPLLRLLAALTPASSNGEGETGAVLLLEDLQSVTVLVPEHFDSYILEHEDENLNAMALTTDLPLFVSKYSGATTFGRRALTMGGDNTENSNVLAIPAGAQGIVVRESRPLVLKLEHPHSGLEYFGLLLSTILPNGEYRVPPWNESVTRTTAAEIVTLATALLTASLRQDEGVKEACNVLGRLSYALSSGEDIITVIGSILEMELRAHLDQSPQEGSLELLIACAEFFEKLTRVTPERVWSAIASSSLLGVSGGASGLAAVVSGTEVRVGRYHFLAICVKTYSSLLDEAVAGMARRKGEPSRAKNRFESTTSYQDSTPERTIGIVLNAYQSVMLDAWEGLGEWRFAAELEKTQIITSLLEAFEKLLRTAYGVNSGNGFEQGIASVLCTPAKTLLDTFTPEPTTSINLGAFANVFAAGIALRDSQLPLQELQSLLLQTKAAFKFVTSLIRTVRLIDRSRKRSYSLSTQLLKVMPIFAELLVTDHALKGSLFILLAEIAKEINDGATPNSPSILSQVNHETATSFLAVVSQLDRPLRDIEVESDIWNFLSTVINSKQQWFSMYLLTGTIPKDRLKDSKVRGSAAKTKSLLNYALDQLVDIEHLAPVRTVAMLKFVAAAQNTWVWATNAVRSHVDFLKNATAWLDVLQHLPRIGNIAQELTLMREQEASAYLCDIFAVNLHASLEIGDQTMIKTLAPHLTFMRDNGVNVGYYNRSLHRNLAENFSRKFSPCQVADFQRTEANPSPYGRRYFYDLDLADRILGHEKAWYGALNGKSQGFADEFSRANVNLSLVKSEIELLKSWRVLAAVLCDYMQQDPSLQSILAKTAVNCLKANVEANLNQPGMDEVVRMRADMAFILVSKLVGIKSPDAGMKDLLPAAWQLLKSSPVDYDVATAPEDLTYYRTLLQALYLSIQPYIYKEPKHGNVSLGSKPTDETRVDYLDPAVASCLVSVMSKVIAPGFRALCGNLHSRPEIAQPGDFALLTAILQAMLSVLGIEAVHQQLADVVASTSIIRGALSLYSWSDQLAEVMDQDPIYGETAITFLLTLSTIRQVAEQMALDGALLQLSSANLSNYFRKSGGKDPFSEPRRMFAIWTEGFLPLCLNLLDAVGPPIAAEISTFLNSFPQQLDRASTALENRESTRQNPHAGAVTLGLASEAHSLCLIWRILESDTARGASEGINAADVPALLYEYEKVLEEAQGLTRQKTSLASRLVPASDREHEWMSTGILSGVAVKGDNLLVLKVVNELNGVLRSAGKYEKM